MGVGFRSFLAAPLGSGMNITSFGMNAHWGNIGGQCCQRAFAWFNPAEYNMDRNTHTNRGLGVTDRRGVISGKGILFATDAIVQDSVYFEFSVESVGGLWFGVGKHGTANPAMLSSIPSVGATREEQDMSTLWGHRSDSELFSAFVI